MGSEMDCQMDLDSAARVLGVHYQTAYRWVRVGILPATKAGGEYRLAVADVEAMASLRQARRPLAYTGRARDWDRLHGKLYAALVAGDESGARRIFEGLRLARVPLLEECEHLLAPVLRRIGEDWLAGGLSNARVRVAAGIGERCLSWAVSCLDPAGERAPVALVVTPKGDDHRLPALMAGAVLRDAGWAVREIDGMAAGEVVDVARRIGPGLAVVSFTLAETAAAEELRDDVGISLRVPVLVGGPGQSLAPLLEDAEAVWTGLVGGSVIAPPSA